MTEGLTPLLLYKSPKTEAASRGAGQLIAKVVQWKGNGLTDNPKSFALATPSADADSIPQCGIVASLRSQGSLAMLLALLGLLRAAPRTARALRAPPSNQGEPFG